MISSESGNANCLCSVIFIHLSLDMWIALAICSSESRYVWIFSYCQISMSEMFPYWHICTSEFVRSLFERIAGWPSCPLLYWWVNSQGSQGKAALLKALEVDPDDEERPMEVRICFMMLCVNQWNSFLSAFLLLARKQGVLHQNHRPLACASIQFCQIDHLPMRPSNSAKLFTSLCVYPTMPACASLIWIGQEMWV